MDAPAVDIVEDDIIALFRREGRTSRRGRRACAALVEARRPLARKARWAYDEYLKADGGRGSSSPRFELDYLDAWVEHFECAARATSGAHIEAPPIAAKTIALTWHFPEYPLAARIADSAGALTLLAQRAPWIDAVLRPENQVLFRNGGTVPGLLDAFRRERPIVAMIDYCYDETRAAIAPLLGYPARTPVGLFVLAKRFGYAVQLLSLREGELAIVNSIPRGASPASAIRSCNRALEVEILRWPARWLLWPSIDRRWQR